MSRHTSLLIVLMVPVLACARDEGADPREGMNAGECADGADNEGDGFYDCNDPDCFGAPDCDEVNGSDSDPGHDSQGDSGEIEAESDHISNAEQKRIEELIADAESREWPDSGGPVSHNLPYALGVHMGISQGATCGGHSGNLEGSIDFTVAGNYESANGLYAVASAAGTVTNVRTDATGYEAGTYGNYVVIRHPDSAYTLYAHLAYGHVEVSEGDEVCAGQPLGLIGSTGHSSGEHLHYEQRDVTNVIVTPSFSELDPVPSGCYPCATSTHESGCYESENEYTGECSGSVCEVDGDIASSTVSLGLLESTGNIAADEGLSKWSLVVDEDIVASESYSTGPSSDSFDASVDISSFEFEDGSHTLALWVRDETGCTGDGPVDTATINCKAESYYQCEGGDVYYYNACGTVGTLKERCGSDEACVNTSSTKAECSNTCGNGAVDTGEDCDGSELGGETCEGLGYDGGELSCASCSYDVSACCTDESYSQCYSGDVYWYDSCGSRGARKDNCDASTEGCQNTSKTSAECYYEAIDNTSLPTTCGTDSQDIFTATAISIDYADSAPEITVTWEKCDGSAFSSTKTCHVRVGSHKSYGVVRETYTVSGSASKYSWETTFDAWTSSSDFDSESCDGTKEFYFTCDDGASTAHWYGKAAVEIKKDCP